MGNSNSTQNEIPLPQISEGLVRKGMPNTFRIAYDKAFSLRVSCLLFEPGADEPCFVISLPNGWYGEMILHGGPTAQHPPLATVTEEGRDSVHFAVVLPAIESKGIVGRKEIVRYVMTVKKDTFWFGIRVGEGEDRHSEKFEWRHSRGNEIKSVGQASTGWKLVRIGSSMGRAAATEQEVGPKGDGFTKDGKEIVAVWAHGKTFGDIKNMGEVQFLGSGATGEFGIQWSIMAMMSCFCIWLRTSQQSTTMAGV
ncbi:hypothetical protein B0T10DRAFT_565873 [Thelonectria olida]|uniref:Uncharacterized protein n=1 Tax=Thelonectria olida TaxID=1576542 RepID=A0A9P8VV06_9HYPO|nr:hypothetical protein B0T10DRAFT_565873 [Thelonectria olida]